MSERLPVKNKKLQRLLPEIVRILKEYGIKRAGIFGSYATGKTGKGSDIDIIVEVRKDMGLFSFVGIKLELEDKLKKKVDLITYNSVHPLIKKRVLNEEVRII